MVNVAQVGTLRPTGRRIRRERGGSSASTTDPARGGRLFRTPWLLVPPGTPHPPVYPHRRRAADAEPRPRLAGLTRLPVIAADHRGRGGGCAGTRPACSRPPSARAGLSAAGDLVGRAGAAPAVALWRREELQGPIGGAPTIQTPFPVIPVPPTETGASRRPSRSPGRGRR